MAVGFTRCAMCNSPICHKSDGKDTDKCYGDEQAFNGDLAKPPFNWLCRAVAIHENKVFSVIVHATNYNMGHLYGKKSGIHFDWLDSTFLHVSCLKLLKNKIKNMRFIHWLFDFISKDDIIIDVANYYDAQSGLRQYNRKSSDDNTKYEDDCNFIWLLQDPSINQKNNIRISNNLNIMCEIYEIFLNFKDLIIVFMNLSNNKNISSFVIDYIIQFFTHTRIQISLSKNIFRFQEFFGKLKTV